MAKRHRFIVLERNRKAGATGWIVLNRDTGAEVVVLKSRDEARKIAKRMENEQREAAA